MSFAPVPERPLNKDMALTNSLTYISTSTTNWERNCDLTISNQTEMMMTVNVVIGFESIGRTAPCPGGRGK